MELETIICSSARHLNLEPSISYTTERFSNGEENVEIKDSIREKQVLIVQSFSKNPAGDLMELIIMIDAVRRSGASKIIALIPIFPYSRQDRRHSSGTPVSAKIVCDMLNIVNVDRIITFDLHADQIQGMINSRIQFDHISTRMFLSFHLQKKYKDLSNWVFCSPDAGSIKRTKALGGKLESKDYCIINKVRSSANVIESMEVIGDVKNRNVVIVDDMIDTGGTLAKAIKVLKENGANNVIVVATHGILSGNVYKNLKNQEVFITDSVAVDSDKFTDVNVFKLKHFIISIKNRIVNNIPLGSLFDYWNE